MAYLIVPVVCFVLLAWLVWRLFSLTEVKIWKGKIDDLDLILSVLMAAERGEPYLIMKVPRRAGSMKIAFSRSVVRLEMPLVTQSQQIHKESYRAILRDLKLDAQVSSHGTDPDILEWEVEGPPAKASAIIKDAFVRLFEVDPDRVLEFRVFAHVLDQYVIDQGLEEKRAGGKAELPTASTHGHQVESSDETRVGCLKVLAGLLLLPLPFMIAYLEFGYVAAGAVIIAIIVIREVYRRWKKSKAGIRLADFLKITVLLLTAATIYFYDPFYLQLIPTVVLSAVAVAVLLAVSFNLPSLSLFDLKDSAYSTRTVRILFSFAIIATCIGGAAMNEYLRRTLTLDAWVWFFAFFRIEFVLGFLVTSIPLLYYMVKHISETESDTDSP